MDGRFKASLRWVLARPVMVLCLWASLVGVAFAQSEAGKPTQTMPPAANTYYEDAHGARPGVFRRDPNIWVLTPEAARRAGMPAQWASSELQGVAAAAFRREQQGAEMDCGWGGNKNACSPVVDCVLELYFDRNAHKLPWREGSPVADFRPTHASSAAHFLNDFSPDPISKALSRRNKMGIQPVFADPETGAELSWRTVGSKHGMGYYTIRAYDREIHGSYSYLKLAQGCGGGKPDGRGETIELISVSANLVPQKTYHRINLPAAWVQRAYEEAQKTRTEDERFYQGVLKGLQTESGVKP